MFLALKLLFALWALCYLVSALVASGAHQLHGERFLASVAGTAGTPSHHATATFSHAIATPHALRMLHGHLGTLRGCALAPSCKPCGWGGANTGLGAAVLPDPYPVSEVETMRKVYGPRRRWWGDLDVQHTRRLYHDLLPVSLLQAGGEEAEELTLEERARRASNARHAARLYARERCALPGRITASLYDGFRHLKAYGTWNASGQTWEEIWAKYESQVRLELAGASEEEVRDAVCWRILEKSCATNKMFDQLAGMDEGEAERHRADKEEALRVVNVLLRRRVNQARRRVLRSPLAALVRPPMRRHALFGGGGGMPAVQRA